LALHDPPGPCGGRPQNTVTFGAKNPVLISRSMRLLVLAVAVLAAAAEVRAQTPPPPAQGASEAVTLPTTICGLPVGAPSTLPPAGTGPYTYAILACFEKQGGQPVVDAQTYVFYMEMRNRVSSPAENRWVPYTEDMEQAMLGDFRRLWATNFLDDLSIEVRDVRFSNGVIGKVVVYNMEERQRVKIVDYIGSDKVDQSKIEEELRDRGIKINLDSFIDPGVIRRVTGVVRELYAEKGYQFAEVKPEVKSVEGGPKLVHVTFNINEGPKVRIREVEFLGNQKVSDRSLNRKMKENKSKGFLGFITGGGTYKEEKFGEDAEKVIEHYRNEGYIAAQVGQPELKIIEDEADGRTRWVQLRIPITEGNRYKIGNFTFEGNTIVKSEPLAALFKVEQGETYSEKKVRKGLEKAKEAYGSIGYYEFVAYPDLKPRDLPPMGQTNGNEPAGPSQPGPSVQAASSPPIVDVTMRVTEGKQYFVNRITFSGNTTTRDNVIRREIRLLEAGVFNTEALKYSIKRLNQLGYFRNIEGDAIQVEKTPGADNKVDIGLKFEEQNRNQLTFGAGVSQFDGFFGQLAFQTSNFLGRGETFSISAQAGNRAKNYQVAFTEPFLFDRPQTAGIDLFIREIRYINQFTQASRGGNLVYGFQTGDFSRMFVNYSLEQVKVKDLNPLYNDPIVVGRNPFLQDSLLIGLGGRRTISKIAPSWVFNTVDQPIFPSSGTRYTLSFDFAGIGGDTNFTNPRAEGIWYFPLNRRTSLGFRAQAEYIQPFGSTTYIPIYERLYLGGEYSIRGFDIRSVGPRDPITGIVLGGNKSLLFNAEYLINIAGPVRLVLFADAGQVRNAGQNFAWTEPVIERTVEGSLVANSILDPYFIFNPITVEPAVSSRTISEAAAFKSSIGAEVRFFMPVLNVPFRLIFAMNPSRYGVYDNNLQPEKKYKFRFAVGTTF
jgi:outer membrane protein insertion porin family